MTNAPFKPKTISHLLDAASSLRRIRHHIEKLEKLQTELQKGLNFPINQHLTVANYQRETLILHTDSAAWAAKLRFKTPEILAVVKNDPELAEIHAVRIKIKPVEPPAPVRRTIPRLSPANAKLLRQTAANVSSGALRSALQALSKNAGEGG